MGNTGWLEIFIVNIFKVAVCIQLTVHERLSQDEVLCLRIWWWYGQFRKADYSWGPNKLIHRMTTSGRCHNQAKLTPWHFFYGSPTSLISHWPLDKILHIIDFSPCIKEVKLKCNCEHQTRLKKLHLFILKIPQALSCWLTRQHWEGGDAVGQRPECLGLSVTLFTVNFFIWPTL